MWLNELDNKLRKIKIFFKPEEPLAPYTTIKIGGPCRRMLFPETEEKLIEILKFLEEREISFFVMGGGSKLLVADEGFDSFKKSKSRNTRNRLFTGRIYFC